VSPHVRCLPALCVKLLCTTIFAVCQPQLKHVTALTKPHCAYSSSAAGFLYPVSERPGKRVACISGLEGCGDRGLLRVAIKAYCGWHLPLSLSVSLGGCDRGLLRVAPERWQQQRSPTACPATRGCWSELLASHRRARTCRFRSAPCTPPAPRYVSIRQHTSTYVRIRQLRARTCRFRCAPCTPPAPKALVIARRGLVSAARRGVASAGRGLVRAGRGVVSAARTGLGIGVRQCEWVGISEVRFCLCAFLRSHCAFWSS
jgi:hypothetical protein